METKQQTSQSFCGRPGCGVAKAVHGFLSQACGNFIQAGSKEANELRRPALSLVETPAPEVIEDEPTAKVRTPSDAELFNEWTARLSEVL